MATALQFVAFFHYGLLIMGKSRRSRSRIDTTPKQTTIRSLAHDGRGVGQDPEGKVVFVDGALPGETVMYQEVMQRKHHLFARTLEVLTPSEHRVDPRCPVFGQCGGCVLQHLHPERQIHYKEQQLKENFSKIGHVSPEEWAPPLTLDSWGYRRRARLGIKYVPKKGGVIIGFRERYSSFIQPIDHCEVLLPSVSALVVPLRACLEGISCNDQIPQVEVSVADNAVVLVLRHLQPFTQVDLDALTEFAQQQDVQLFLQPGKLNSVHPLWPVSPEPLYYELAAQSIRVEFLPTDFIQVNGDINQAMVARAIEWLDINEQDDVLDLFSGVGNFTLPLARSARSVVGVEGERSLVERALANAERNGCDNIEFYVGNLFEPDMTADSHGDWLQRRYQKILLDPPRSGAAEMIQRLPEFAPERIVYVSCGPATLARDAGVLVNELGYTFEKAGVIDMFPHTAHVESIALFTKAEPS